MKLGDSEGEGEAPIKWRHYEIETLKAIHSEMKIFYKICKKKVQICALDSLLFIWKWLIK